eukprot:05919.XXX_136321_142922_1 [CDS] Oithona nana genome sequencing.
MLITSNYYTRLQPAAILILQTLLTLRCCESIHLEAVLVPQYRYRGSNASLLCKYELQANEELFSLKWYKEDTEFYRHTPPDPLSQPPPMTGYGNPPSFNLNYPTNPISSGLVQTWPVPGIKIDEENSRPQHVILKRVTFKSSGTYRCEVTAVVRPRRGMNIQGFEMKESINKMVVVELPSSQPQISGGNLKIKYKPGDALNLTCTSAPSNPPASLEWIVNNKKIVPRPNREGEKQEKQHLINKKRGLYSSTIALLLTLEEEHFRDGELRVKCRGTIAAEFWKRDVENVYNTERDSFVKVLEVKESQWPASANLSGLCKILLVLVMMLPIIF